ncbi:MAG: hypothetical protein ABI612_22450 [Betaproteobacteria bacterium]
MNRWAWLVKRALIRLRWYGLGGLALLVFTVGLTVFSVGSTQRQLKALDSEAAGLKARLGKRETNTVAVTGRSQLSNFYAFFPLAENVPELLGRIYRSAQEHQLLLEKGEYKLSREAEFRLARYQITLPMRGQYADVRGFVNDVLESVPSAALEELTLKRESIDAQELEARVRFIVFLGAP